MREGDEREREGDERETENGGTGGARDCFS